MWEMFMSRYKNQTTKKDYIKTAMASFIGVIAAVPMVMAVGSPNNAVNALQGQGASSSAQVSGAPADFAKFVYAYNQGSQATLAAATTTASSSVGCTEATATADKSGVVASARTGAVQGASTWKPVGGSGAGGAVAPKHAEDMVKAYYSYYSVFNSSSSTVTNTNSNNTVGSNNSTETKIEVEDAKGVMIGVSNDPVATNVSNSESFNKDSYNPETSVINDSFNKEMNVAIDSGNTTTENTAVTKVEDSYNTETKTETETNTTEIDVVKTETDIEDSYNNQETSVELEVELEDVEIET